MASTVPAAKAALIDLIEAQPEIQAARVPVLWGAPTDSAELEKYHELIHLGDVDQEEEWGAVGGGGRRDERYAVEVVIYAHGTGKRTEQETEQRAWDLRDEIAEAISNDKELGGVLRPGWCAIDRTRQENTAFNDGWGTRLTLTVACITQGV